MGNQKDWIVRVIEETTPGTTPAGSMQATVWNSFGPQSGGGPGRQASGGVSPDQQIYDNPATYTEVALQGSAPSIYNNAPAFRSAICGQAGGYSAAVTVTGSDIAAVVSGNKLTKVAGGWSTFGIGDIVQVDGLTTNGTSFVALIGSAPTSTDLPFAWPTLLAEAAGASVTVKHLGRVRIGSDFVTLTVEQWHTKIAKGDVYRHCGLTDWTWGFDIPNPPQESFSLLCGSRPEKITAQLANATTAAPARSVHNSNTHFGYKAGAAYGGGFRYSGTLFTPTALRIKKFEHKLTRPVKTSGGAGDFGPMSAYTDGLLDLTVTLEVMRDSAAAETLHADRRNIDTVASIGFAMIDPGGKKWYRYYPALQFLEGGDSGLNQEGEDFLTFPMKAKSDGVIGMFQDTLLG